MDEWQKRWRKEMRQDGLKDSNPDWYGNRDKGGTGNKRKGKGKGKALLQLRRAREYRSELSIQVDEEVDQGSSWGSELEGEKAEELASLETPGDEGRVVPAQKEQDHQVEKARLIQDQHFTTLPRMTRVSKRLED